MNTTYRITLLGFQLDTSTCPPPLVFALWPSYDGWQVSMTPEAMTVQVPAEAPSPADLGPLVKVEQLS